MVAIGLFSRVPGTGSIHSTASGVFAFAFRLAHAISSAWESVVVKGREADVERAQV